MGLLEERERAARQRVEVLQAELREAEAALGRFVIAHEAVGQVPAEPSRGEDAVVTLLEERSAPVAGAVPGAVVPMWREGLDAGVLASDYPRIMAIVTLRRPVQPTTKVGPHSLKTRSPSGRQYTTPADVTHETAAQA
jgi:hypothetical protein